MRMLSEPEIDLRAILCSSEEIPRDVADRIVALGPAAVEPLLGLLRDRSLWERTAAASGYAPVRAMWFLRLVHSDLGRLAQDLVAVLADVEVRHPLHDALIHGLPHLGTFVLDPLLELLASTQSEEALDGAAEVISKLGSADPRVLAALVHLLETHTTIGAFHIAYLGLAALPHLHRVLEAIEVDERNPRGDRRVMELADAIECLGGELSDLEEEKLTRANAARDAATLRSLLDMVRDP